MGTWLCCYEPTVRILAVRQDVRGTLVLLMRMKRDAISEILERYAGVFPVLISAYLIREFRYHQMMLENVC